MNAFRYFNRNIGSDIPFPIPVIGKSADLPAPYVRLLNPEPPVGDDKFYGGIRQPRCPVR